MSDKPRLFQQHQLGAFQLSTRVVMAPLTRQRAGPGEVPRDLNAEYYGQRSAKGVLLITEATQVAAGGQGYPHTPGIFTKEQAAGWKKVVDAVHAKEGLIFLQLWHVGSVSHSSYQVPEEFADTSGPISASDVRIPGKFCYTKDGQATEFQTPRAITEEEVPKVISFFQNGAALALEAGFDGVEIHGANGYLLQQFLSDGTNKRTDKYGGSIENRCRFVLEIVEAVAKVYPTNKIGIRLSPWTVFYQANESDPMSLYTHLLGKLNDYNLAYVHLIEPRVAGGDDVPKKEQAPSESLATVFRPYYKGTIIIAGGYTRDSGIAIVEKGDADCVAYGRQFISNPDLPYRLEHNLPLNKYDRSTFYAYGPEGYTDYPFYQAS